VIPATLLAFDEDFSIDEQATRKHTRDVCAVRGISAVTINAHASEIHACTFDEQRRILAVTMEEVGDRLPVVNGVYADGSIEAARIAKMAEQGGASALLVLPPHSIGMLGGQRRPEMAITHFKRIADATDLPIVVFQYSGEYAYPMKTLLRMADEIPSIRAIKDWSPPARQEEHVRALQSLPRPVHVLSTNSAWMMASLTFGCNGLLSGSGSVIADLHVALFDAVKANDLARARRINDRIYPTAKCFYTEPFGDMHNRMKEALVLLGRLPRAVVRPPLVKLPEAEIRGIEKALRDARIGRDGALLEAA
jgi:4-hydroxy-tetrahydrodipicolinate synthase